MMMSKRIPTLSNIRVTRLSTHHSFPDQNPRKPKIKRFSSFKHESELRKPTDVNPLASERIHLDNLSKRTDPVEKNATQDCSPTQSSNVRTEKYLSKVKEFQKRKEHQRRRRPLGYLSCLCCSCSCLALLPFILGIILIGSILTAVLLALLVPSQKSTTTSRTTISLSINTTSNNLPSSSSFTSSSTISTSWASTSSTTSNNFSFTTAVTSTSTVLTTSTSTTSTSTVLTTSTSTTSTSTTSTTTRIGPLITSRNDTVFGVWNTTAGQTSSPSSSGNGVGDYYPSEDPDNIIDENITTKYTNFGRCNSSFLSTPSDCGLNTGFYLTLRQGPMVLSAIRFCTANSYPDRDPIRMTVEGSNQNLSMLPFGSSWTLLYNGTTGLDTDPGRYNFGQTIIFSNSISYSSYRILIPATRNLSSAVQYAEVNFIG